MSEHTPGPWHVDAAMIYDKLDRSLALCRSFSLGITDENFKANTNLMAAAPDMLDALNAVISNANLLANPELVMKVRSAISKATGESDDQAND